MEQQYNRVTLAAAAWRLALDTSIKLQTASEKHMLDLTMRQYMALEAIAGAKTETDGMLNSIAQRLDTTKQNTKQLVDALMEKGYIQQARVQQDRRAINITITDRGREALQREGAIRDAFLHGVYACLTDDELDRLLALLHKLYAFDGTPHPYL